MSPFAELGLDADADERAVKRAYAARLRQTRPEDDPQGFQALHAAYQAALAHCRQRESGAVAAQAVRPLVPALTPEPAPGPIQPEGCSPPAPVPVPRRIAVPPLPIARFDLGAFVQGAIAQAGAGDAAALERWLHSVEALWSLDTKAQAGHALVSAIYRQAPPMPEACLDTLLAFFGLDHARAGHDPLALQQLRRRVDLAWHLAPAQRGRLALALRMTERSARRKLDAALRQVQRPFHWSQALLRGLPPAFVQGTAGLVQRLCGGHLELLPASIDRRQLAFWLAAADTRRVSRPRLALAGARMLAALLCSLPLGLLFGWVANGPGTGIDPGAIGVTATCVLFLGLLVFAFAAWAQLVRWQADPTPAGRWAGRIHTGLIPLLVGLSLSIGGVADAPFAGWPVLLLAAWLAVARSLRGQTIPPGARGLLWVGFVLASPLARSLAETDVRPAWFTAVFAAVALGAWGVDLARRRPWRLARAR